MQGKILVVVATLLLAALAQTLQTLQTPQNFSQMSSPVEGELEWDAFNGVWWPADVWCWVPGCQGHISCYQLVSHPGLNCWHCFQKRIWSEGQRGGRGLLRVHLVRCLELLLHAPV